MAETEDELILRLSYRDPLILITESMIAVPRHLSKPNPVHLHDPLSSNIGRLDCLPLELLHQILQQLDVLSLYRLATVSHRGRNVVHSLTAFRDLNTYGYPALVALGMTELLHVHSLQALHSVLTSDPCVSCGDFGPFLFLPTCERCCYWCLKEHRSLWLITTAQAKKIFSLRVKHLREVPVIHTVPGKYCVGYINNRSKRFKLVSVKTIKRVAISVHGRAAISELENFVPPRPTREDHRARWIRKACIESLDGKLLKHPSRTENSNDMFRGMGSIRFPVLRPGPIVEEGHYCRGCYSLQQKYRYISRNLPRRVEDLIPVGVHPGEMLEGMARVARSRVQFLEHIKTCVGLES